MIQKSQAKVEDSNTEIKRLCAKNYAEFLQTLECSKVLKSAVDTIKQNVVNINGRLDQIDSGFYKEAKELQDLNLKIDQISKAKGQLEMAKKFVLRLNRCEHSVSSVAL